MSRSLALVLLLSSLALAHGRLIYTEDQRAQILAQSSSGLSLEQEGGFVPGASMESSVQNSDASSPFTWLVQNLEALEQLQRQVLEGFLLPSYAVQHDPIIMPLEAEPQQMLHRVGCHRFHPAMQEMARKSYLDEYGRRSSSSFAEDMSGNREPMYLVDVTQDEVASEESSYGYYDLEEQMGLEGRSDNSFDSLSDRVADKLVDLLEEAYSMVYGEENQGRGASTVHGPLYDRFSVAENEEDEQDEQDLDYDRLAAEADVVLAELEDEYFGDDSWVSPQRLGSSGERLRSVVNVDAKALPLQGVAWGKSDDEEYAEEYDELRVSGTGPVGNAFVVQGSYGYDDQGDFDPSYYGEYEYYYADDDFMSPQYYYEVGDKNVRLRNGVFISREDGGAGSETYTTATIGAEDAYDTATSSSTTINDIGSDGSSSDYLTIGGTASVLDWLITSIVMQMLPQEQHVTSGFDHANAAHRMHPGHMQQLHHLQHMQEQMEAEDRLYRLFDSEDGAVPERLVNVIGGSGAVLGDYETTDAALYNSLLEPQQQQLPPRMQQQQPAAFFTAEFTAFFFPFAFLLPQLPAADLQQPQPQPLPLQQQQPRAMGPLGQFLPEWQRPVAPAVVVDNDLDLRIVRGDGSVNWGLLALMALVAATLAMAVGFITSAVQLRRTMCRNGRGRFGAGSGTGSYVPCLVRRGSNGDLLVVPLLGDDGSSGTTEQLFAGLDVSPASRLSFDGPTKDGKATGAKDATSVVTIVGDDLEAEKRYQQKVAGFKPTAVTVAAATTETAPAPQQQQVQQQVQQQQQQAVLGDVECAADYVTDSVQQSNNGAGGGAARSLRG